MAVFWVIAPCSLVEVNRRFGGASSSIIRASECNARAPTIRPRRDVPTPAEHLQMNTFSMFLCPLQILPRYWSRSSPIRSSNCLSLARCGSLHNSRLAFLYNVLVSQSEMPVRMRLLCLYRSSVTLCSSTCLPVNRVRVSWITSCLFHSTIAVILASVTLGWYDVLATCLIPTEDKIPYWKCLRNRTALNMECSWNLM
jgi:hypothetical protein